MKPRKSLSLSNGRISQGGVVSPIWSSSLPSCSVNMRLPLPTSTPRKSLNLVTRRRKNTINRIYLTVLSIKLRLLMLWPTLRSCSKVRMDLCWLRSRYRPCGEGIKHSQLLINWNSWCNKQRSFKESIDCTSWRNRLKLKWQGWRMSRWGCGERCKMSLNGVGQRSNSKNVWRYISTRIRSLKINEGVLITTSKKKIRRYPGYSTLKIPMLM